MSRLVERHDADRRRRVLAVLATPLSLLEVQSEAGKDPCSAAGLPFLADLDAEELKLVFLLLELALKVHRVGHGFVALLGLSLAAARGVERLRSEREWWLWPLFDFLRNKLLAMHYSPFGA